MKLKSLLIGSLLMALATTSMAQVTLTQTTTSDFMKGTGQNVVIADDNVSLQSKMLAIDDYVASTNLPQTLMNHQLVTWQTYVFCVGGQNGSNPVNTVYRASQQSSGFSSWTTMNNLPVALTEMAVAATQTNLIVLGGKNDDGVSDKIYVASLNLSTAELGNWSESPFMLPQPLRGARAIAVHDNIYLIGGANTDDEVSASDKVYCLKLNSLGNIASIEEVASLPEARNGHAVATYDSKIYVLGGHDAAGILKSTVWTANVNLDGTLGAWQSQAVMPLALKNHTAVCANGILAFLGGMGNDLPSTQLYYADLSEATLNWTLSNVILSSRIHSGASCAFGNKIFYTGGQNLSGSVVNLVCYAPIVTGAAKVGKACFVSLPFDLGYPQKTIDQLAYNLVQTENTSYEVLYRVADTTLAFGNWISGGTNAPVTVGQTKHVIQYMFRLTATSTDDIQLQDVSVIMSGFTQLAGNLNSMSVLSAENSPYYVTSTISFTSGIHDIDPGVVIYFTEGTSLNITYACMRFNGTEESPILLTYGNDDNHHWNGMFITGSNSSNQGGVYSNTPSSLSYTIIEKAGVGDNTSNLCLTYANRPTFSHCISRNSAGRGIYLSNSSPTINDCSFEDNATTQMYLYSSSPTVSSTTMTGGNYGVYLSNSCSPTFTNCVSSGNIQGLYSYTPDRSFSYNESNLTRWRN